MSTGPPPDGGPGQDHGASTNRVDAEEAGQARSAAAADGGQVPSTGSLLDLVSQAPAEAAGSEGQEAAAGTELTFPAPCNQPSGSIDMFNMGLDEADGVDYSYCPVAGEYGDQEASLMDGYDYPPEQPIPIATVDEQETLDMLEVVNAAEKAQDPLLFLEQGVQRLGEFEVSERTVLSALRVVAADPLPPSRRLLTGPEAWMGGEHGLAGALLLTEGHSHADERKLDWKSMWMDKLQQLADRAPVTQQDASWSDVAVTLEASVVVVKDAAAKGSPGVLRQLLPRFKSGAVPEAVFALPAVQAVISFKWSRFARGALLVEVSIYIVWLVCHCAFSLLLMDESADVSLASMLSTPAGLAALATSAAANVAMLLFIYGEVCVLMEYGWSSWFGIGNTLDMMSYGLQVLVSVLHLSRWPVAYGWFSCLVSIQHVLLWGKLVYYTRVFESTRDFRLIETVRLVLADAGWLLVLLTATMMGFGFAFYTLYKEDREAGTVMYYQDHTSLSHSMYSTFMYLLAMFDMSVFYGASHPVAATILFISYSMLAAIFLLNVLVAAMTASYQKVRAGEALRLLQYQAQVIDEVESQLPRWVVRDSWFPAYLHVLRVAPAPSYEVDPRHLWTGTRKAEDVLLAAHKESCDRMAALEVLAEDLLTNAERTLMAVMQLAGSNPPGPPAHMSRTPSTGTPAARLSRTPSGQVMQAGEEQGPSRESSGATPRKSSTAAAGDDAAAIAAAAAAAAAAGLGGAAPELQQQGGGQALPSVPAQAQAAAPTRPGVPFQISRSTRNMLSQLALPALAYVPAYTMKPARGALSTLSSRLPPPRGSLATMSSLPPRLQPSLSAVSRFQPVFSRAATTTARRSAPLPAYTTNGGLVVQPGVGVARQLQPALVHLPSAGQRGLNPRLMRSGRTGRDIPGRVPGAAVGRTVSGRDTAAGAGTGVSPSSGSFTRRGWVVRGPGASAPLPAVGLLLPGHVPLAQAPIAAPTPSRVLEHHLSREHHDGADESEWTSVMDGPDDRDDLHEEQWADQPLSPQSHPSTSHLFSPGPYPAVPPSQGYSAPLITPHPSMALDASEQQATVTSPSTGYLPRLDTIPESRQAAQPSQPTSGPQVQPPQDDMPGRRTSLSTEYSSGSSGGGLTTYSPPASGGGALGGERLAGGSIRRSWHTSLSGPHPGALLEQRQGGTLEGGGNAGGYHQGGGSGQHTTLALHPLVTRRSLRAGGAGAEETSGRLAHSASMPAAVQVPGSEQRATSTPPPLRRESMEGPGQEGGEEEEDEEEESYRERQAREWVGALPGLAAHRAGVQGSESMPPVYLEAPVEGAPSRQRLRRAATLQPPVYDAGWTAPVAWIPAMRVAETVARLRARALAHRRRRAAAAAAGGQVGLTVVPSTTPATGTPADHSRRDSTDGGREPSWQSSEGQVVSGVSTGGLLSSRHASRHRLGSSQLLVVNDDELEQPLLRRSMEHSEQQRPG